MDICISYFWVWYPMGRGNGIYACFPSRRCPPNLRAQVILEKSNSIVNFWHIHYGLSIWDPWKKENGLSTFLSAFLLLPFSFRPSTSTILFSHPQSLEEILPTFNLVYHKNSKFNLSPEKLFHFFISDLHPSAPFHTIWSTQDLYEL